MQNFTLISNLLKVLKKCTKKSRSAWNSRFLIPFFDFFKQIFFEDHISTFKKLWSQTRKKSAKNKNKIKPCYVFTNMTDDSHILILSCIWYCISYRTENKLLYFYLFIFKNQKNLLKKCVLDLNFAPIKGSVFLIF